MEIKLLTQSAPPARQAKGPDSRATRPRREDQEPPAEAERSAPQVAEEEEDTVAARLREAMEEIQRKYKMKVELDTDEETGRQVVRILSQDGQRLVRQIPPQEALEMASRAWDDIRSHIVTWRG